MWNEELGREAVGPAYLGQEIGESYRCSSGGELEVEISNLSSDYKRTYRLGRWGGEQTPIVPGKTKRAATKKRAVER